MKIIERFKDGTERYIHPVFGTETWYTPGRRHRPMHTDSHPAAHQDDFERHQPQDYCDFCPANIMDTTPEKVRIVKTPKGYVRQELQTFSDMQKDFPEFRRLANLFEIISTDYWKQVYGYQLSEENQRRKQAYLADPAGREHVMHILRVRFERMGVSHAEMQRMTESDWLRAADFLFGGTHDLLVARRHFVDDAENASQLFCTGDMNPELHAAYTELSRRTVADIFRNNSYVKFVSVYTNWKRDAGASFEHLHRQILGMDRYGAPIRNMLQAVQREPGIFTDMVTTLAKDEGLAIAENEHAIAYADAGHPFTTAAIYCKEAGRLSELSAAAMRGMSDLAHAIHAAFGRNEPVNEEWYYTPPGAECELPFMILIKWRKNRHAGLEGSTHLYIDAYRPIDLKRMLVKRLKHVSNIGDMAIGDTCPVELYAEKS